MSDIVTFGEIMLRLSTPGFSRFVHTNDFNTTYGGGEANVAVALSSYGLNSYFVSRLPEHEIGESASRLLFSQLSNPEIAPEYCVLNTELEIRESTRSLY